MSEFILNFIVKHKMLGYAIAFAIGGVCMYLYWIYGGRDGRIAYLDDKIIRLEKNLADVLEERKAADRGNTAEYQETISRLQREKEMFSLRLSEAEEKHRTYKTSADARISQLEWQLDEIDRELDKLMN